ncbi:Uncharacterized protein SCF082_LOCUS37745 [Durusdinium trenchii]|uniref:Uncharacterized protein n=1 Tax=Durusdinium trenchii TaxID=1381693 RepID=A0ABP0PTZ8_9DINO
MLRSALIATARLMPVWSKLVPVMPDGALFPDFDCVHVGVIDGIDWSDWLSIFEKAPKSWAAEGSRYFDAFMDADAESYQRADAFFVDPKISKEISALCLEIPRFTRTCTDFKVLRREAAPHQAQKLGLKSQKFFCRFSAFFVDLQDEDQEENEY